MLKHIEELKDQISGKTNQVDQLHDLVQTLQDDKIKLSKKVSKLLDNGKSNSFTSIFCNLPCLKLF
jgi:hypothetical protein